MMLHFEYPFYHVGYRYWVTRSSNEGVVNDPEWPCHMLCHLDYFSGWSLQSPLQSIEFRVAKNRAANDSFADRQNTATSTMSDGNIDGGEYSSDEDIAAILFVFDRNTT